MVRLLVIGWWRIWGWHYCRTRFRRRDEASMLVTWQKGPWEEVRDHHWDAVGQMVDLGWVMDEREIYLPSEQ